jgi:hypothetical protein
VNDSFNSPKPTTAPRQARFSSLHAALCLALLALITLGAPSHAVTLRQKWVPGQQLLYDMTVSGTMTLLDDDESPQPWAGLPMDFRVRGNGAANLETLSVDDAGIGTIVLRGGDSQVRAVGLGQVIEFSVKNGLATALMNGKPVEGDTGQHNVADPNFALRLGPRGRLEGTVELRKGAKTDGALPFDFMSSLQSWMLQSVPTLWPEGDVKEGDKWTAPLAVPLPPRAKDTPREPLNAGQVTFTLRGVEDVGGRKAQRVALAGGFDIDAAKAKILNEAAADAAREAKPPTPPKTNKPAGGARKQTRGLADAKEKLSGDLWLDTATGQIVRAELKAEGRIHTAGTITNKAGKTRPTETWADFDGSTQFQLRRVTYASVAK